MTINVSKLESSVSEGKLALERLKAGGKMTISERSALKQVAKELLEGNGAWALGTTGAPERLESPRTWCGF